MQLHILARPLAVSVFTVLLAFSAAVLAQADYAATLKPGARITVDIAGYKYQGTYTGPAKCRDGGQCVGVTDDNGVKKQLLPRYIKPPEAGAAAKAVAGRTDRPSGRHTCSAFGGGQMITIPGFTLKDNGSFTDHAGTGKWAWDAATSTVSFSGGAWNGQKARKQSNGSLQVLRANGSLGSTTCSKA